MASKSCATGHNRPRRFLYRQIVAKFVTVSPPVVIEARQTLKRSHGGPSANRLRPAGRRGRRLGSGARLNLAPGQIGAERGGKPLPLPLGRGASRGRGVGPSGRRVAHAPIVG
jgi:hypothetical protein